MRYEVPFVDGEPALDMAWSGDERWECAKAATLDFVRPEGSGHRPRVEFKMVHDGKTIYVAYRVHDRYVRSVQRGFPERVCTDSCVEVFLMPQGSPGYFNFEFNAGGALYASYITDWERTPEGFREFRPLPDVHKAMVCVYHSLPEIVEPEITRPVTWELACAIPVCIMEKYTGLSDLLPGTWRGNLYKCADETSHPHWLSWSSVSELNFHLPGCFGEIVFL